MNLLLGAAALLLASAFVSLFIPRYARIIASAGAIASLAGLLPSLQVLLHGQTLAASLPWGLPIGAFALRLDPLSAFFVVPILGLTALAALYGIGYMGRMGPRSWFFYNTLAASMLITVIADDGILFLMAWELMTLASYFLVVNEDGREDVRQAGFTYLAAAHIGTALLLMLFALMDFKFAPVPARAGLAFGLALVGFGTKAGFVPMHVWLPEAHPAAPSHVSALMSGVMIKTGVYGLVRVISLLGPAQPAWGWALLAVGGLSGVLGVLFALAQHDLKRLLAYHSVENVGIIAMGLGLGLLGQANGLPVVTVLGFAGALLHVVNHAMFKGLLFLGAGSVLHAAGTRDMERLGGLMKRMPLTGSAFMVGAAAICGLPPFNGFVSEFLIFLAALLAVLKGSPAWGSAAVGTLALIGGLALACFAKAFGIVFLGEPRTEQAAHAHESGWPMLAAMGVLAVGCLLIGLAGPQALILCGGALRQISGLGDDDFGLALAQAREPLSGACGAGALLLGLILAASALRRVLLRGGKAAQSVTWDCGYAAPDARMQYTASSFAQPITDFFSAVLRTRELGHPPQGYFPGRATLSTQTPDILRDGFYEPAFRAALKAAWRLRALQHGRVQVYILYLALTLAALLIWELAWR